MDKIDKLEQDARVSAMFGDTEKTVRLYGRAIRLAWKFGCSGDRVTGLMIKASNALVDNGMPDDAFEGLRSLSLAFIKQQQPECALRLSLHLPSLYNSHPALFPNAPALGVYIKTICEKQMHM
jgi:hypothetical protein